MKTRTGRLWVYVRDDRPFGGQGPPAALYDYSPSRHGEYPRKVLAAWSGVMQADAFSGYNALYEKGRKPAPVVEAACWAHGRRDFFDFAKLTKAPIAVEIVRRIDELFAIERDNQRPAARGAARGPAGAVEAARRRARSLYARAARAAVAEERVNGAAIFLKSRDRKFPSLAGRRSAVGVIGASVLWRAAATLQGRREWERPRRYMSP